MHILIMTMPILFFDIGCHLPSLIKQLRKGSCEGSCIIIANFNQISKVKLVKVLAVIHIFLREFIVQ